MVNLRNFSIGSCVVASPDVSFHNTQRDRVIASLRHSHTHTHHLHVEEWRQPDFKSLIVIIIIIIFIIIIDLAISWSGRVGKN